MPTVNLNLNSRFTIVAQGDSLCYDLSSVGTGHTAWQNYNAHDRWIDRITTAISGDHTMYRWASGEYTSYSVGGVWTAPGSSSSGPPVGDVVLWDRSMGGMKADRSGYQFGQPTLPAPATTASGRLKSPDLHIIQFGTNDIPGGYSTAAYKANVLARIADYPGARQVLLIHAWKAPSANQTAWNNYKTALDEIASGNPKCTVVKIPDAEVGNGGSIDSWGHLNATGHQQWFDIISPFVKG